MGLSSLGQRHLTRFVPKHSALPMLVSRMNVTFHDSDRVVTEDFRERRQVNPLLHACREGVPQIAKNKIQRNPVGLGLLAETIMRLVHP